MSDVSEEHSFAHEIRRILREYFAEDGDSVFSASPLIGYLCSKTRAANRGSKSRGAFANLYALYVIVEDYVQNGFDQENVKNGSGGTEAWVNSSYTEYEGVRFSDLFRRQRELPFGAKLQNHALNSRLNDEFRKFYPSLGVVPITRDLVKNLYWVQESLLLVTIRKDDGTFRCCNIAKAVLTIIDAYVAARQTAFQQFLKTCRRIATLSESKPEEAERFVLDLLRPEVDARIFEIVSFAILKAKYADETIWIGRTRDSVVEESFVLHKTGRTNANDGGIDFVMRPIGRFFQVTETVSVDKYFLDIDKVQRFPITFVVKSNHEPSQILDDIRKQATAKYGVRAIVDSFMEAIEEIIPVPDLATFLRQLTMIGKMPEILSEIVMQSRLEFNDTMDRER